MANANIAHARGVYTTTNDELSADLLTYPGDCSQPDYSRRYGSPFSRTPRTEDGRPVPAGLLARGSSASFRPSRGRLRRRRQWHFGARLAAYSCGGSRGMRANGPVPRSLFTRRCPDRAPTRTVTHLQRSRAVRHESIARMQERACVPVTTQGKYPCAQARRTSRFASNELRDQKHQTRPAS